MFSRVGIYILLIHRELTYLVAGVTFFSYGLNLNIIVFCQKILLNTNLINVGASFILTSNIILFVLR